MTTATTPEQSLFDYLTKYRALINLAGLAEQAGLHREALSAFLNNKRGLPAPKAEKLRELLREQAQALAAVA